MIATELIDRCWARIEASHGSDVSRALQQGQTRQFIGFVIEAFAEEQAASWQRRAILLSESHQMNGRALPGVVP